MNTIQDATVFVPTSASAPPAAAGVADGSVFARLLAALPIETSAPPAQPAALGLPTAPQPPPVTRQDPGQGAPLLLALAQRSAPVKPPADPQPAPLPAAPPVAGTLTGELLIAGPIQPVSRGSAAPAPSAQPLDAPPLSAPSTPTPLVEAQPSSEPAKPVARAEPALVQSAAPTDFAAPGDAALASVAPQAASRAEVPRTQAPTAEAFSAAPSAGSTPRLEAQPLATPTRLETPPPVQSKAPPPSPQTRAAVEATIRSEGRPAEDQGAASAPVAPAGSSLADMFSTPLPASASPSGAPAAGAVDPKRPDGARRPAVTALKQAAASPPAQAALRSDPNAPSEPADPSAAPLAEGEPPMLMKQAAAESPAAASGDAAPRIQREPAPLVAVDPAAVPAAAVSGAPNAEQAAKQIPATSPPLDVLSAPSGGGQSPTPAADRQPPGPAFDPSAQPGPDRPAARSDAPGAPAPAAAPLQAAVGSPAAQGQTSPAPTPEALQDLGETFGLLSLQGGEPAPAPQGASAAPSQPGARHMGPAPAVAAAIIARAEPGQRTFELRLDPPELGKVQVSLSIDRDGVASARVVADQASTLGELVRAAREIERALTDAGLKVSPEALTFSLADRDGAQQRRDPQSDRRERAARAENQNASDAQNGPLTLTRAAAGRLDLRI